MKIFKGKDLREVWDYRLSHACPFIDREGETWKVLIYAKSNEELRAGGKEYPPLEEYYTGIKSETNDHHDKNKIKACYKWLYSVRDKYALEDIEQRKPYVKAINEANEALAKMDRLKI